MAGKTLNLRDIITEDQLGCEISRKWTTWNMLRQNKIAEWSEVRKYVYATDTTTTTNSKLPWKNKTTIPKLCQIRDNLHANYMATSFPKKRSFDWEANTKDANQLEKRKCILNWTSYCTRYEAYRTEMSKLYYDLIDYGNAFATVEWLDTRQELEDRTQVGYVGWVPKRISPLDLVMNPIASTFASSPKIIRSLLTLGDIKEMLSRMATDDDRETYEELYKYLYDLRSTVRNAGSELSVQDDFYQVDGFTSFRSYLESDYVEVLTFYGDLYDYEKDTFMRNHVITVVDRHKVIAKKPNPSFFGQPPIFHAGWRTRQDNLWAMGPLDNLVGMQYRIDHMENLKADVLDFNAAPVLKIRGSVEDFEWGPFARVYVGDDGDVEMVAPPFQILQFDGAIQTYEQRMEEMSGSPKEAAGFRTPGEKTKYEVQRLENAASRIFQAKILQFEQQIIEPVLNAGLELSRRNIVGVQSVPVINDEFNITVFQELTASDITGAGRLKPTAARHFAEKAELIQNLTGFFASPIGMDPGIKMHWSTIGISKLMEEALEITDYELVQPNIRLAEEADAKKQAMVHEQQTQLSGMTPAGLHPADYDENPVPQMQGP